MGSTTLDLPVLRGMRLRPRHNMLRNHVSLVLNGMCVDDIHQSHMRSVEERIVLTVHENLAQLDLESEIRSKNSISVRSNGIGRESNYAIDKCIALFVAHVSRDPENVASDRKLSGLKLVLENKSGFFLSITAPLSYYFPLNTILRTGKMNSSPNGPGAVPAEVGGLPLELTTMSAKEVKFRSPLFIPVLESTISAVSLIPDAELQRPLNARLYSASHRRFKNLIYIEEAKTFFIHTTPKIMVRRPLPYIFTIYSGDSAASVGRAVFVKQNTIASCKASRKDDTIQMFVLAKAEAGG
ncbi:hypothetical protein DL96DRAFT_1686707 [Flagelloscypha sp. PMI_526]|nr:hypothetical protein DL96DRAFT_1686707 [Flagelloscypha sp. PMI_526]